MMRDERRKPGRPPSEHPLSERMTVRLTMEQMARFQALLDAESRVKTKTDLLRLIVLDFLEGWREAP